MILNNENSPFYHTCDALNRMIKSRKRKVNISDKDMEEALEKTLNHLLRHNNEFSIQATMHDVYKLVAWYGHFLSNTVDDKYRVVYLLTINLLNKILSKEKCGKCFTKDFRKKIFEMLRRDDESEKFSIGKNGLYLAFRSAKDICKQLG